MKALRVARQVLLAFLLRHGYRYNGRTHWTRAHKNWIADIKMPHRAQQIALQEYVHAAQDSLERVDRLTHQIQELLPQWSQAPLVAALQALRGVSLLVAVTTVAELGDLTRFQSAKQLMAYLGLVPSEHSSGGTIRRGGITKTGNAAMVMYAELSLKPPMLIVIQRGKAAPCLSDWTVYRQRSDRLPGRHKSDCAVDFARC